MQPQQHWHGLCRSLFLVAVGAALALTVLAVFNVQLRGGRLENGWVLSRAAHSAASCPECPPAEVFSFTAAPTAPDVSSPAVAAEEDGPPPGEEPDAGAAAAGACTLQHRHHIYARAAPDPYGCSFRALPGAWTGAQKPPPPARRLAAEQGGGGGDDSGGAGYRVAGGALFGTVAAQRAIWAHQHPANCSAQRFLLHSPQHAGIGSQLHMIGLALAVALDQGRVLLLDAHISTALYTDDPYCGPGRPNLDDCYFYRISNCSLADAGVAPNRTSKVPPLRFSDERTLLRVVRDDGKGGLFKGGKSRIPQMMLPLLLGSPIQAYARTFWWKAQAVTYVVRPNRRTRQELEALRQKVLVNVPASLATAVSVHVRHGDKWIEASEQPSERYFQKAQALHKEANGALEKHVFLSTEDPAVVAWFEANATGWRVAYTKSNRKPDRKKSTVAYAREHGPAAEFLDSLLNLELALECGAWVGTLSSNWCRLIDEMRSSVRCKADGRYLDAAQHDPPLQVGWR